MHTFVEFLSSEADYPPIGELSDWLRTVSFEIKSGILAVADPTLFPDGIEVSVKPGNYHVDIQLIRDEVELRVAKLRVSNEEDLALGATLGDVSVDFGSLGVGDSRAIQELAECLTYEESEDRTKVLDSEELVGVIRWDDEGRVVMPFVRAGYGDGRYAVFGLHAESRLAGVEVDFLKDLDE